ncbi:TetR/AcrR family transcriptional regulator [Coralliovum pocilloporae]|uniref:TetR/AcrR family transcriptional regulator n=1 Tax=Coralliovum pocilloporae TaxID=3066369 RepID=UPI0033071D58
MTDQPAPKDLSSKDPSQSAEVATNRDRRFLRILDAALGCIVQKGFHSTSMRDISRAAGVSLGNLYNYFASKEALIVEIAALEADSVASIAGTAADITDPLEAIEAVLSFIVGQVSDRSDAILMLEVAAEAARNDAVADLFLTNRKALIAVLDTKISDGVRSRQFLTQQQPDALAETLLDMADAFAVRPALGKAVPEPNGNASFLTSVHALLQITE